MRETILITGGLGYIGSHTCVALAQADYKLVVLDNYTNAKPDVLKRLQCLVTDPIRMYQGDVRDSEVLRKIFTENDIAAVIHLAALKSVGESVHQPLKYIDHNFTGLTSLLKAMREARTFRLVFSSSATVYGTPEIIPVPETAPLSHSNPYGFSKLIGEQLLSQLAEAEPRWAFGVLRYFNPAGAHPSGLIGEDPLEIPNNLIPYVARVALGELPEVRIFGDDFDTPDGTGVRDYIHVEDLAHGHVLSLQSIIANGRGHVVNLGTGKSHSVHEVVQAYSRACGRDLPWATSPRRPGDVAVSYADPQLAERLLGFRTRRNLNDICQSDWNWLSRRQLV